MKSEERKKGFHCKYLQTQQAQLPDGQSQQTHVPGSQESKSGYQFYNKQLSNFSTPDTCCKCGDTNKVSTVTKAMSNPKFVRNMD